MATPFVTSNAAPSTSTSARATTILVVSILGFFIVTLDAVVVRAHHGAGSDWSGTPRGIKWGASGCQG
jgi:hypothetical protein